MQRTCLPFLSSWLKNPRRLPLVIRGARQVGKTWIVRNFAELHQLNLIEINLEERPELFSLFTTNDPREIVRSIETSLGKTIDPSTSLLFIDEIQVKPELIAKLRWFAEKMPELPVVVAGSLLEFVFAEHSMSMPVGRIDFMYLEPLTFEEFLLAYDKPLLVRFIKNYQWGDDIPSVIHEDLLSLFKEYVVIGGMPAAVQSWVEARSLSEIGQIHHRILATYRADFHKYSKRISTDLLDDIIALVPLEMGRKFIYSKVDEHAQTPAIKRALKLLCQARVCHRVIATSANGLPLSAEENDKYIKVILLDVGLCSAALGLSLNQLKSLDELELVNKGGIAEQVVGQLLRTVDPFYIEPHLYYWQRFEKGASAEVDFVIQHQNRVVPVEVKSGTRGAMKSLHLFMGEKSYATAVRIYSGMPAVFDVDVKDPFGKEIHYQLRSMPYYLISEIHRLLD